MRKAIETAPMNGLFVILEDAAHGTFAVARWSVETTRWLDEDDTPIQFDATHWQLPHTLDKEVMPNRARAPDWHSPTAAKGMVETADAPGSLTGPGKPSVKRAHRETSSTASGSVTAQPRPVVETGRSVSVWKHSNAMMAACFLVGAAFTPLLYRSDAGMKFLFPKASNSDTGLKQALEQEQERANKLAGDVTAAGREAESQAALVRQASEAVDRQKEASESALAGARQALQLEQSKTEKLTGQLAEAQRDGAAQTALTRKTITDSADQRERVIGELRQALKHQEEQTTLARRKIEDETLQARQEGMRTAAALKQERDKVGELRVELATAQREGEAQAAAWRSASSEAKRLEEANGRAADERREALQQAQDKAERLAAELATTRREIQTQESVAGSAKAEVATMKEAAERSADEQRRALQLERDKAAKLTAELAEARSNLQAQTKAKAADDVVRDNNLTTIQSELQKAKAEVLVARKSLEAEHTRAAQIDLRLTTIEAASRDNGSHSLAPAALAVGQPSRAALSVADAQTKTPAGIAVVVQPPNSATRSEASVEQAGPHAVRLIARANFLLDQGNIGAARNMLDRAAEMGSIEALFWLAETYDPLLLSARKTFGTQSDIAKARELYRKALAGGVSEAKLRLDALKQ